MLGFLKKIVQSTLFKIGSLNSIANLIKIFSGLFSFKITSYYLGPSGIAILENFRNFISLVESIGTLGFQSGIVKYVATNENDLIKRNVVLSTAFFLLLFASIIISISVYFLNTDIEFYFLSSFHLPKYFYTFFSFSIPFLVMNVYFLTVLNALSRYKIIIYCNVIGYLLNLFFVFILIYYFQLYGAVFSLFLTPLVLSIISFYYFDKEIGFKSAISLSFFSCKCIPLLGAFSLMALVSGILSPLVFIEIRNLIVSNIDLNSAGLWSSLVRISGFYMMFVVSICSLYFYPQLSKSTEKSDQKLIIKQYLLQLLPFVLVGFLMVYFARNLIIEYVMSSEFDGVSTMFKWQLLGDFCKAIAMIFGYYLLANRKIKAFIFLELLSLGSFYLLTKMFINLGVNWVVISYFYSNLIYLISIVIFYFFIKNELSNHKLT